MVDVIETPLCGVVIVGAVYVELVLPTEVDILPPMLSRPAVTWARFISESVFTCYTLAMSTAETRAVVANTMKKLFMLLIDCSCSLNYL